MQNGACFSIAITEEVDTQGLYGPHNGRAKGMQKLLSEAAI